MTAMTVSALIAILRESAGEEEGVNLAGDVADTTFVELGYDSLALLEAVGRVQRDYAVALDDEVLADVETPRQFIDAVNERIAA